ncbi:MAG TPA: hypothetical protein PKY82_06885 [Pyrinomonadaceae bacterium]|nr:hypothetical protein [Pyrinomonadaceae bacterium]
MTSNINFDELARKSFSPKATGEDHERLFAAVFNLPEWYFIDAGETPRCGLFPEMFGDQPALLVFTSAELSKLYTAEKSLNFYGADSILNVSTTDILDYIEQLIPKGAIKIFFNPNYGSFGFHHDLKMMRPIYEHLETKGLLTKNSAEQNTDVSENQTLEFSEKPPIATLIVQIKDGLGFPSGFVKASDDTQHLFCRVPSEWIEGEQLKPAYLEKIYAQLYGVNWREGNSDGSHYQILDSYTKIFSPETVKTTKFGGTVNQDNHQFYFYIGDKYDHLRKVTAEQFQADVEAEIQKEEPNQLNQLLEENADVIAQFDKENELLSAMIAGSAASMDEASVEDRERIIDNTADMFKSLRTEYKMSPKLFKVFIESCLNKRKLLMPVLAFAYLQQDKARWQKLEEDNEFVKGYADWLIRKMIPGADILMNEPEPEPVVPSENITTEEVKIKKATSETSSIPFDELSRKAFETNAIEDLNALFGAAFSLENWLFIARGEMPNLNPYIAANPEFADGQQMIRAFTDSERLQRFARENNLTGADGSALFLTLPTVNIVEYLEQFIPYGVHGIWFNSDSESEGFFIPLKQLRPIKEHLTNLKADNLAKVGISETPEGDFEQNLVINQVGTVHFDTSIAPFYEAIVPILADYRGTGEFLTLLRFEPSGKSQEVESIMENSHGAYLEVRRFLYLNPKNNLSIGVNSIHSNSLRHIKTNAELLVSIELCRNYENQTNVFYHRFQGPNSEVSKLTAAIQPILESVGYEAVQ